MDRFFDGLYQRRRRSYIETLLALTMVWLLLIAVPVHVAGAILCAGLGFGDFVTALAVSEGLFALAVPGLLYLLVRRVRPAIRLLRDDPTADPAAAWSVLVIGLPGTVFRSCLWLFPWAIPMFIFVTARLNLSFGVVLGWVFGMALWMAGSALFAYLLLERAVRPAVREALAGLPTDFEPPAGAPSLRGKMLATLLLLSLFSSTFVGGATLNSTNSLSLEMQFVVVYAVAGLFMVCLALPLTQLVRESFLTRVAELRAAMASVDRGEYVARVVPLGGDEIDQLGRSFNQMVGRLRRHDAELRDSRARIVTASDEARRRVERDLHDGAQQHLVALRLRLGMAKQVAASDARVSLLLEAACAEVDRALDELRDLAHGIFPASLANDGLVAALEVAAERSPLPVRVVCEGDVTRLAPEMEAAVYFCCLEALQNASKHAGPTSKVVVRLDFTGDKLDFEVRDDGIGYDPSAINGSAGLQNMTDRISAAGGTVRLASVAGAGTTVSGSMPQFARR